MCPFGGPETGFRSENYKQVQISFQMDHASWTPWSY